MTRATYRGPGDSVTIDGLEIAAGETIELDPEQINRLRASDPEAVLETSDETDTPEDRERIREAQDERREKLAGDRAERAAATTKKTKRGKAARKES